MNFEVTFFSPIENEVTWGKIVIGASVTCAMSGVKLSYHHHSILSKHFSHRYVVTKIHYSKFPILSFLELFSLELGSLITLLIYCDFVSLKYELIHLR